jgi:hypothetical protein
MFLGRYVISRLVGLDHLHWPSVTSRRGTKVPGPRRPRSKGEIVDITLGCVLAMLITISCMMAVSECACETADILSKW